MVPRIPDPQQKRGADEAEHDGLILVRPSGEEDQPTNEHPGRNEDRDAVEDVPDIGSAI